MRTKRKQQSKRKQQERNAEAWRHLHAAALIKAYERNALEYGRLPVSEGECEVESEATRRARDGGAEHPQRAGEDDRAPQEGADREADEAATPTASAGSRGR